MGNELSIFTEDEKKQEMMRWPVSEHTLRFDEATRTAQLPQLATLFPDGARIAIHAVLLPMKSSQFPFLHYFITSEASDTEQPSCFSFRDVVEIHSLENGDSYEFHRSQSRVSPEGIPAVAASTILTLNEQLKKKQEGQGLWGPQRMNDTIRQRMRLVLGMNNHSWCLRNTEHVVRYVCFGLWQSDQFSELFLPQMSFEQRQLVNSFPAGVRPFIFDEDKAPSVVYNFITEPLCAPQRFSYYLDKEIGTYNVLFVGPTGSGKSHLINTILNSQILPSIRSHHSVTKDVHFVRGKAKIAQFNSESNKGELQVILCDTIGLCDTSLDAESVLRFLKSRVHSSMTELHCVAVVYTAFRLTPDIKENVKDILLWLHYTRNHRRFLFICTHSDVCDEEDRVRLRQEAIEAFELDKQQAVIFVALPSASSTSPVAKQTLVLESVQDLRALLRLDSTIPVIDVSADHLHSGYSSMCTIL